MEINQYKVSNKHNTRNVVYLTFLIAMSLKFWGYKPLIIYKPDVCLVVEVLFLLFGYIFLFHERLKWNDKRLWPMWLIIAGILLSMVTARAYYGQGFSVSLIAYRVNILWLSIPVLFKMKATFKQMSNSSIIITALLYVMYFTKLLSPGMFDMSENEEMNFMRTDEVALAGFVFACVPIFYYLGRLREGTKNKVSAFVIILFCYSFLFLYQNRSTLFIITLLIGYSILVVKSKYRFIIVALIAIVLIYFVASTIQEWSELIQETQDQIGDPNYNRNLAYAYFFTASPNIWCILFGNGFLSSHTSSLMEDMMNLGVYNSDVGFVGFWNQYGIIPILAFLYTFVIALKDKNVPFGIKLWCLLLIGGMATISYFQGAPLIYTLFYYLVEQYHSKQFLR